MRRLWQPHRVMLGLTLVLFVVAVAFVDLAPRVDDQFFFASDDPQLQESNVIDRRFPSGSQLIGRSTGKRFHAVPARKAARWPRQRGA
jgi:hypothetical protein